LKINLIKENKRHNNYINRLVFDSFVGIKNTKNHIDHIDRNILNNNITNLREATPQENALNRNERKRNIMPIMQYSLNDEFIKEWDSPIIIQESLNIKSPNILKCCTGDRNQTGGFKWKYKNIIKNLDEFKVVISDDGKIYSNYKINKNGTIINKKNRQLTSNNTSGYYSIKLKSDCGVSKGFRIHRLVALTFIKNPHNYEIVNHVDENKLNNNVDNLQWCTIKQNVNHSLATKIHQVDIKTSKIIKTFASISDTKNYFKLL